MMPVPTHLREVAVPLDAAVDEEALDAVIRCTCGGELFSLLYPGSTTEYDGKRIPVTAELDGSFFFRIEAVCAKCNCNTLLFDKDFHGWDGYVCHDAAQAALPRPPLIPWKCLECGAAPHAARVAICTQGKDDFVENLGDSFPAERWPDGFGWFYLSLTCSGCKLETENWVDYETM